MILRLGPLMSGGAQSAEVSSSLNSCPFVQEYERAVIFRLGRLFYCGAHGVSWCLVKLRALRPLHLSILVSVLDGGDI